MKKGRIFGATLLVVAALLTLVFTGTFMQKVSAYAQDDLRSADSIFSDKQVEASGYLYNFDGSADYIYADFTGSTGYAIFAEETLEILEYTTMGDFPYATTNDKKYYGGPRAYFNKSGDQFIDAITNESFTISAVDAEAYAQVTRQSFAIEAKSAVESEALNGLQIGKLQSLMSQSFLTNSSNGLSKNSSSSQSNSPSNEPTNPPLDEGNWISPTAGATYIANSDYFLTAGQAPRHGNNNGTSCTAVATQLMLSYNNFYNDRRIIAPEHLNGGWNAGGNGNRFDAANYTNAAQSPNVSPNPKSMTSWTLGANQAHHDLLFNSGITGFLSDADNNLRTHLNGRGVNFTVTEKHTFLDNFFTIGSKDILAEIDAGRPLVIATSQSLNGTPYTGQRAFNHAVIAYGYQTFAAYAGSGNSNNYLGYIVHMGWDSTGAGSNINIWTNSAWYYSYMSLQINHTHNYTVDTGNNHNNTQREVRCGDCGHRELVDLYNVSGSIITNPRYPLSGSISIPSTINGTSITAVGSSAFANQTQLSQISIPASVKSIGDFAFSNCSMTSVGLQSNSQLTSIGAYAFYSCSSLNEITIPKGVTSIGDFAFSNCTNLSTINFNATSCHNFTPESNVFLNAGSSALNIKVNFGDDVARIPSYLFYDFAKNEGLRKLWKCD